MNTFDAIRGLMDRTGADGTMTEASFDDAGVRCELLLDPRAEADGCWTARFTGPTGKHAVKSSSYSRVLAHGEGFWTNNNRKAEDFRTWLLEAADELVTSIDPNLESDYADVEEL